MRCSGLGSIWAVGEGMFGVMNPLLIRIPLPPEIFWPLLIILGVLTVVGGYGHAERGMAWHEGDVAGGCGAHSVSIPKAVQA